MSDYEEQGAGGGHYGHAEQGRDGDVTRDSQNGNGIAKILDAVINRIAIAERRQTKALEAMQSRIDTLTTSAVDARKAVPDQFQEEFQRLEDAMGRLAAKVRGGASGPEGKVATPRDDAGGPAASALQKLQAAFADPGEVADRMTAGNPEQPWDQASAEELTRLYESGVAGLPYPASTSQPYNPSTATDLRASASPNAMALARTTRKIASASREVDTSRAPEIEKQWLEERFSDVAKRIEQILSETRSEAPFEALDERFSTLEARLGTAVQDLAKRSDVAGLAEVEACISEIAAQLEKTHAELSRVSDIEHQVRELASRVTDERLMSFAAPPVDVDAIASVVVDRLKEQATREPAPPPIDVNQIASGVARRLSEDRALQPAPDRDDADNPHLDELKTMVRGLVESRRDEGEHTATMLDTMQQAMIRLLDRMDEIEERSSQPPIYQAAQPPTISPAPTGTPSPTMAEAEWHRDTAASERTFTARDAAASAPAFDQPDDAEDAAFDTQDLQDETAVVDSRSASPSLDDYHLDRSDEHVPDDDVMPIETEAPAAPLNRQHFMEAARRAAQQANQRARQAADEETEKPSLRKRRRSAGADDVRNPGGDEGEDEGRGIFGLAGKRRIIVAALAFLLIGVGATTLIMKTSGAIRGHLVTHSTSGQQMPGVTGAPKSAPVLSPTPAVLESGGAKPKGVSDGRGTGIKTPQATPVAATEQAGGTNVPGASNWSTTGGTQTSTNGSIPAALIPSVQAPTTQPPVTSNPSVKRTTALPAAMVGPLSLRISAANGDPSAEFEVGARFAEGQGIQQDFKQATKWYRRSATHGFALSQYRLATLYERGLGVDKDLARAKVWYQRAAAQGNVKAMHNLAVLAAGGDAGKPDYGTAAQWFEEAAKRGLGDSQFNLAILYQSGLGVPLNAAKAYTWFGIAAKGGDSSAKTRQAKIARTMKAVEIATADQGIATWRKQATSRLANDPHYAGEQWKQRATNKN